MNPRSIDINCDLGESIDPKIWLHDSKIMPYISSCNIACGGHAGNPLSIEVSIKNALKNKVKIGAHPSFPDQQNFGRKEMDISLNSLRHSIRHQLKTFKEICNANNASIHHIKPHGALYNLASKDLSVASLIAEEIVNINDNIVFFGLSDSLMYDAAQSVGVQFWHEGFMDRCYHNNGNLVARSHDKAVHKSIEQSIQQALQLAQGKTITPLEGGSIKLKVDTICLHGDHHNSLFLAQSLSKSFIKNNIAIG